MAEESIHMPRAAAEELVRTALQNSSTSAENAASVARALVAAEVDGQAGHGFSRVASYAAQARSGKVDGNAKPEIVQQTASFAGIDAVNGFAFPAIDLAIETLTEITPKTGLAGVGIRRSHHCGQLGAHVERLADQGLVALMVTNAPKAIAPWGGHAPLFGTNPIAFAAPRKDEAPLVIDLSLSKVARGKIMAASKAGKQIPEGWALSPDGQPTTDPKEALAGTMIPAGDAKGAALALIVEILAATLIGANHSYEATSFFDAEGGPPGVGQTLIAFAPDVLSGGGFSDRLEGLLNALLAQEGTRLPGTRRLDGRSRAERDGVAVPAHLHAEISAMT